MEFKKLPKKNNSFGFATSINSVQVRTSSWNFYSATTRLQRPEAGTIKIEENLLHRDIDKLCKKMYKKMPAFYVN